MIRTLRVRNLAVIEDLELRLGAGLTVITGETGAGKSVLLSAISLLSGRRVSTEAIRSGESEASVEALFDSQDLLERARELGLAHDEDSELLVSRTLSREGRGRVRVNGNLSTVGMLAQLTADAIEVTSQGEHQRLLRPEVQLELLDAYADHAAPLGEVAECYARWRALMQEVESRISQAVERARRCDQLRFELEQIEAVDPLDGELEQLEGDLARLAHVDRLMQHVQVAREALESDAGASGVIARARAEVDSAAALDPGIRSAAEGLTRAGLELDEVVLELESYQSTLEADPARLEQVERRLGELARLQSRYGATISAILAHRDAARDELEQLDGGESRTLELERDTAAAAAQLASAADRLGRGRRSAAADLERAVQAELKSLELGSALFRVAVEPQPNKTPEGWDAPSGPRGAERVQFMLAANRGEEARGLRDAASGGELSRLLLALRNTLRDAGGSRVLLFDEIDAGVGGKIAGRVGERLCALGRSHQILCITHLPQIAAQGSCHYHVWKRTRGGRTRTGVEELTGEARVEELASMAAGKRVTDAARAHARELLAVK
jgi:DNA repair protein RecN (Recombination protein N)